MSEIIPDYDAPEVDEADPLDAEVRHEISADEVLEEDD